MCAIEDGSKFMLGGDNQFDLSLAANRALLNPVNVRYDELHAAAYPAGVPEDDELLGVPERYAVYLRSKRGVLTGLREMRKSAPAAGKDSFLDGLGLAEDGGYAEERGLLADSVEEASPYSAKHLCLECYKALSKNKLPKRALVNGTWQGLVPVELKDLTDIECQMLGIFNVVQFLKPLPSGAH